MNQSDIVGNPVNLLPKGNLDGYDELAELALDVSLSWKSGEDDIWRQMSHELWDDSHNPWVVLNAVSRTRLQDLLANAAFRETVDKYLSEKRQRREAPTWFQQTHAGSDLTCAAYFSMEYMLSEALPIYSGGLGNVAGDQLKAASDLGVPVVGVGLLYQQGYFRQMIDKNGNQQELYPYNDPGQLPISPVRTPDGEWLRFKLEISGATVWLRAWQGQVGTVMLYLLDTNDPGNLPTHRGIAGELYGGGPELRLQQEMVLGIGGWRLLEALALKPAVCHLNEGHAAFAILERARSFMLSEQVSFDVALATTRIGNLFTTHTAAPAGIDRFPLDLMERYMAPYAANLGVTFRDLLALGQSNASDPSEPFNMANLAVRGSGAVNGVSRLHGQVSRRLFSPLFPRWPEDEVPIGYITNGIHVPTWSSALADKVWIDVAGIEPCDAMGTDAKSDFEQLSDTQIWDLRNTSRADLVDYVRERYARQLTSVSESVETVEAARHVFDPKALMIGFARRFATYKRPNLLLRDPERLVRLLKDSHRPVQLLLGGKAHPADRDGQDMIRHWVHFLQRPDVQGRIVFLSDYDMHLTQQMVAGVDVWLNTPRRPWEACGTSGMKVLANGGINFSELDGWWAEAYTPEVGWALGDGMEHDDVHGQDEIEANALYEQLENEVVGEFYDRDASGIPSGWIARIRKSMTTLTPQFSARRAVKEYVDRHYLPAATSYRQRAANQGALGKQVVDWQQNIEQHWANLRVGEVKIETVGDRYQVEVELFLNGVHYEAVQVEMFADGKSGDPTIVKMARAESLPQAFVYRASISSDRPYTDYTVRVLPQRQGASIPLECRYILWQR